MLSKVLSALLVFIIIGCGDTNSEPNRDGSNSVDPGKVSAPPPQRQSLPAECHDTIDLVLRWTADNSGDTYKFILSVGNKFGEYYQIFESHNGLSNKVLTNLKRGSAYQIKVEKFSTQMEHIVCKNYNLIIPTCEQRINWASSHPKYYEPLFYNIDWKRQTNESCWKNDSEQNF